VRPGMDPGPNPPPLLRARWDGLEINCKGLLGGCGAFYSLVP